MSEEKENSSIVYNYCLEDRFSAEDLEWRHLYLNGEIDDTTISSVAYHIMRYNKMDIGIPVESRKPIYIYINSPGGSVLDGYGVIDAIKLSKTPVYTVNIAGCMSMAFMIYIAGHKRYAFPHSEFLLHDGFAGDYNSAAKVRDRMNFETDQIEAMTKKFILENTKISSKLYDKNLRVEWYFLPQEGKNLGVVDYIIGEDCDFDEII